LRPVRSCRLGPKSLKIFRFCGARARRFHDLHRRRKSARFATCMRPAGLKSEWTFGGCGAKPPAPNKSEKSHEGNRLLRAWKRRGPSSGINCTDFPRSAATFTFFTGFLITDVRLVIARSFAGLGRIDIGQRARSPELCRGARGGTKQRDEALRATTFGDPPTGRRFFRRRVSLMESEPDSHGSGQQARGPLSVSNQCGPLRGLGRRNTNDELETRV